MNKQSENVDQEILEMNKASEKMESNTAIIQKENAAKALRLESLKNKNDKMEKHVTRLKHQSGSYL